MSIKTKRETPMVDYRPGPKEHQWEYIFTLHGARISFLIDTRTEQIIKVVGLLESLPSLLEVASMIGQIRAQFP
jgi:hypothetical protein